jgi:hypothetical protein
MATMTFPLFPLGTVLFPEGVLPLQIFEVRYLDMISRCIADDTPFGVVLLTHGSEVRRPDAVEQFMPFGTLASVQETTASAPGLLQLICCGESRFKVASSERQTNGLWMGQIELVDGDRSIPIPDELQGAADALDRVLASLHDVPEHRWPVAPPFRLDDCGWVANRWCELLPLPVQLKQRLMELENPLVRLELVSDVLTRTGITI